MIYFTSDQHFGHANIIKYCNRPFENHQQMDKEIIKRYNSKVTNDDIVYFLGDLTLHKHDIVGNLLKNLKGNKILILGNHDSLKPFDYIDLGFTTVHTALEISTTSGNFILVHDPAISQVDRSKQFLCGHIHDLFKSQKNCINVGVDVWNFYPVSLENLDQHIRY